jgi:hypothetical protein
MRTAILAALVLLGFARAAAAQPEGAPPAGMPIIVTTTGSVNLTGSTVETNMAALKIPANSLGKNGIAEVNAVFNYTNNANAKGMLLRLGTAPGVTTGGVTGATTSATTTLGAQLKWILRANNATNSQNIYGAGGNAPFGVSPQGAFTFSVDTTQDIWMNISATLAVATDTITLVHAYVVIYPHQ